MTNGMRLVALFLGYGAIGFGGDYAMGLFAQDVDPDYEFEFELQPEVEIQVDIEPEVVVDVQVRDRGSCSYEATREYGFEVSDHRLVLEEIAGKLNVEGRQGLDRVEVVATMCASSEASVREMDIEAEVGGGEIVISAHYPDRDRWRGDNARMDITVYVPLGLDIEIEDSAGSIEASGTGDLRIGDSAGGIRVTGANGSVWIDDSAGSLRLSDVAGDVEINDSAGPLTIEDVEGSVHVNDGAGSITVREIDADVFIDDLAGSITAENIGGDLTVTEDVFGGLTYSDVRGNVDVPEHHKRKRRGGR